MSIWVIGDIHGCFDTFVALLSKLPRGDKVCVVGDLIDRGPKSRQVVQYVIDNNIDSVVGNHEIFMIEEYDKTLNYMAHTGLLPRGDRGSIWTVNGGYQTLMSYESYNNEELDDRGLPQRVFDYESFKKHYEFMKTLPTYLEYPEIKNENDRHLVVSHSVLHNVWHLRNSEEQQKQNNFRTVATWTRNFHNLKDSPDIYNIIGHTPQNNEARVTKIYANVDTGCVFKQYKEHGFLTAIKFPEMEIITQENIDIVNF